MSAQPPLDLEAIRARAASPWPSLADSDDVTHAWHQAQYELRTNDVPALLERVEELEVSRTQGQILSAKVTSVADKQAADLNYCPICMVVIRRAGYATPDWDITNNFMNFEHPNPVIPGHRLFAPRKHLEAADAEPMLSGRLFEWSVHWAAQQGGDYNLITSGGPYITETVPHAHIHYVPRTPNDGLKLPWPTGHPE